MYIYNLQHIYIYINKYLYYITKSAPLIHRSVSKTSNSILCEKRFHSFVHRYRYYLSLQILWNQDKVILFINICQPYLFSLLFHFFFLFFCYSSVPLRRSYISLNLSFFKNLQNYATRFRFVVIFEGSKIVYVDLDPLIHSRFRTWLEQVYEVILTSRFILDSHS